MASFVGNVISGGEDNPVASTLYGTCSSLASTAEKVVTIANVDALLVGMTIHVKFLYSNTAADPTVNVNGTGALPLYVDGTNYPGTTPVTSWQANTMLALTYDGTAWRMNDPGSPASNNISSLLNLVYPVGAIYMSVNSTDPSLLFGGTWAQIQGKFLLAADTGHTAGSTGGAETVTLQTANLPSHTHTVGAHAHGLNSHTHTVPAHAHGLNSHTHSVGAHTHGLSSIASHVHSYIVSGETSGSTALTVNQIPSHTHGLKSLIGRFRSRMCGDGSNNALNVLDANKNNDWPINGMVTFDGMDTYPAWNRQISTISKSNTTEVYKVDATHEHESVGGNQGHSHSIPRSSTNTTGPSANMGSATDSGGPANTGAAAGTTANSTQLTSGGPSTTNTANSSSFNSGATGSGTAVNKMPPYLSVYCWKRTA